MENEMVAFIEKNFNVKVYEIKYVDIDEEVSVVSKANGFKGFADYALSILAKIKRSK